MQEQDGLQRPRNLLSSDIGVEVSLFISESARRAQSRYKAAGAVGRVDESLLIAESAQLKEFIPRKVGVADSFGKQRIGTATAKRFVVVRATQQWTAVEMRADVSPCAIRPSHSL